MQPHIFVSSLLSVICLKNYHHICFVNMEWVTHSDDLCEDKSAPMAVHDNLPASHLPNTKGNTNYQTTKSQSLPQLFHHFNKGTCNFGDHCKFIHDHRNWSGLQFKNHMGTSSLRPTICNLSIQPHPSTYTWAPLVCITLV